MSKLDDILEQNTHDTYNDNEESAGEIFAADTAKQQIKYLYTEIAEQLIKVDEDVRYIDPQQLFEEIAKL